MLGRGATLAAALRSLVMVAFALLPAPFFRAQIPADQPKALPVASLNTNQDTTKPAGPLPLRRSLPPRVLQAQRFLAQRGWIPGMPISRPKNRTEHPAQEGQPGLRAGGATPKAQTTPATWQPLGPDAVVTPTYGLVTGRVTALALDPSDATGNHLYVGTTGGGVWQAQNAAVGDASLVTFTPLTDAVGALSGAVDASISIGALTVQPGGTGVILAGTGDPNDALDSYYGAGILRSADGGNSWSLITATSNNSWKFLGEGFAGFAWSTANPQLVVAAVSQAYEGTLVNVDLSGPSYEGLYYSADGGVTWNLATITEGANQVVQGPGALFDGPDGNAATAVVWNPVRQVFVAAVRFHGYYQSADGITWTRMATQPGVGLTAQTCPTNSGQTGSVDCPIFRGALAVNPLTGDTFAWTVDAFNQDQGLWQDQCAISNGTCSAESITFSKQWNTQALETDSGNGAATIANGDYTLALAAVPGATQTGADTLLLAGDDDLWRCSLAKGCVWRNTTNANTCMSAQVAGFEHALAWNAANPLEIFIGNDGGLWRSLDAIAETGPVCDASDATHFQNLNGGLGSLAEVESLASSGSSSYTMMTGLGVNGTAGLKSTTAQADWPQILGGNGGPVAVDPFTGNNWYVNNQDGVSIYVCSGPLACTPADFGATPVVSDNDVGGDGYAMALPAPFLVDPLDSSQLLIGTCRVWRGPANGVGWGAANAISPILDSGTTNVSCNNDALIRSMAALPVSETSGVVYLGMYGAKNGAATLPGHILSAIVDSQNASMPVWRDLTANPVTNSPNALNLYGMDVSSIFVDSHDPTGNTVYATLEGFSKESEAVQTVYGSTDGGAHWASLRANLPSVPVSGLVVDPQSADTVYLATDAGVYFTTEISSCANLPSTCWSVFGSGLPQAPVTELSAAFSTATARVLTAGTYGRGVWQTPLWSAATGLTMASASPNALMFAGHAVGSASSAQTVTLMNTGSLPLSATSIVMSGDFSETDNCQSAAVALGGSCTIQVTFIPTATGSRTGQLTISANVYGGQLTVALTGAGTPAPPVSLMPAILNFGQVEMGTTPLPLQIEAGNSSESAVPITAITIAAPFSIASNACGASALAAESDCQLTVEFSPTQSGAAAGTLTFTDGAGTQIVQLSGTGAAPPTDSLNPMSISFSATAAGQLSSAQVVVLSNSGDLALTSIAVSGSGPFQTSNNCGTQLAGHAACTINVVFAPTAIGSQTGVLTVSDALRTQTVQLSGTGVQPATLSVSPGSLTFAVQNVRTASAPQTLTITNNGGVAAGDVGFEISGPAAASFAVGTTTCGTTLASSGTCTVQVIFAPVTAGGSVATLTVSSATGGVKPVTVALNGAGNAPSGLNVNPAQLTFAATVVGTSSSVQTVTISNNGNAAVSQLTLFASLGFNLTQNTCAASLAAGTACTVGVVFAPAATGAATGMLSVTSASADPPANVTLSGTGALAAAIRVTPQTITFVTTGVGQTSSPVAITVTNTGAVDSLSNLALTVPAGFELVNNACGASLGPGASCTTGVEFAPTAAGAQTGSLIVSSSTVTGGVQLPLAGMGFDFTVTVSGASAQSVAGGLSASFTLVLTPLNGSSGAFAYACKGLPANAVCVFNPPGETLNAGVTGNVTAQVSTGGSAISAGLRRTGFWGVFPLVCGMFVLPPGWKKARRTLRAAIWVALLAILVGGAGSCASSGGETGGGLGAVAEGGTTPAGTYTIPVTVTSTGVSHSATLTLTVD